MVATLLFVLLAAGIRTGLHHAGYNIGPFEFWPVHLFFLVLIAYLSGYRQLRLDRTSGMGALMRDGIRDTVLYAVLIGVLSWVFYTYMDPNEFAERNAIIIDGLVNDGFSEADARQKVSGFYTPANYAGITFLALLMTGAVNTLLFAVIHHRLLRRFMR
ncbi:MAG TPA: hypothetical protein VGE21_12650 [Flavobacteriales bacterium]